jgi:hypothetical protein
VVVFPYERPCVAFGEESQGVTLAAVLGFCVVARGDVLTVYCTPNPVFVVFEQTPPLPLPPFWYLVRFTETLVLSIRLLQCHFSGTRHMHHNLCQMR